MNLSGKNKPDAGSPIEIFASFVGMNNTPNVFHFDEGKDNFETFSKENGSTYWWSTDLMSFLGYESQLSYDHAVSKAMTTCNTLKISVVGNFDQVIRDIDGKKFNDFKLSRFACYLIVMNGDPKKEQVAKAQAYFATIAGAVQNLIDETRNVERLLVRDEISERETSLSGVAMKAGVTEYGFFQNAGYRGMYNKNIGQLKAIRNIEKGSLLDFMGKDELAANLFRITQTELKIKTTNVRGQNALEATAENVGQQVRKSMIAISGVRPEDMPPAEDIKQVRKKLKDKSKTLKNMDNKKKLKKKSS